MNNYAVVLQWETESDIGDSPVLIGVHAENEETAMKIALEKAESGELYVFLFGMDGDDDEPVPMTINENASFVCPIDLISFIN